VTGRHDQPHWHDADTPLHRVPAEVKVVGALALVVVVISVPQGVLLPYLSPLVAVVALAAVAHLRARAFLRRLLLVVPVLAFALLLPLLGPGPDVQVLGVGLSEPGLWSMAAILAKGLLGAGVALLLSSTTEPYALLGGLRALHVPAVLVAIAMFMVRFLVVIEDEARTMAVARASRGHDPRWLAQAAPVASSVGALFVRSFERGERVHAAMVSRGWTGSVPDDQRQAASTQQWTVAAAVVAVVLATTVALRLVAG
jgi:cobalt/nickel transport system permease protein